MENAFKKLNEKRKDETELWQGKVELFYKAIDF